MNLPIKNFYSAKDWKYSDILIDTYADLLKEFNRIPKFLQVKNGQYKIDQEGSWKGIPFIIKSKKNYFFLFLFPTVRKLLKQIPIYDTCVFSILGPDAKIKPHKGHSDRHLRVHLGIQTDGQAWIRVGDQVEHWKEKEILIFNDYNDHEVFNPSDQVRVVFYFDIKRENY